jgi:hypothetical protein
VDQRRQDYQLSYRQNHNLQTTSERHWQVTQMVCKFNVKTLYGDWEATLEKMECMRVYKEDYG